MSPPKLPRASRVGRIAKWLAQQANPLVTELQLETEGDGDTSERIATWIRDKTFDATAVAQEVEDILSSILAEQETKVVARLVWLTDQGARWTTFPIKIEAETGSQAFDGSTKNLLVQQQRHIEGIALTYFKATDQVLRTYSTTLESLTRLIEARENRSADLETEIARLRDENAQLASQVTQTETLAEQAIASAESAASEMAARKESEGTDGQMLKLLSKVATDVANPKAG